MPSRSTGNLAPLLDLSAASPRRLRTRGLANILRMGHCAPSIMQAMLEVSGADAQWLVKLMAGLPGGIGNTGNECGAITAPLLLLGLHYGQEKTAQGLPVVVCKGHDLLRRFKTHEGTTACRDILCNARVPVRCIRVVRQAPVLCAESMRADCTATISVEQQEAFLRLYDHWLANGFHCAHAVFEPLGKTIPIDDDLLNGSLGFMGGTIFTGMTCSALTAGVMVLGLKLAEIENSHLRVLHMIGLMAIRGDAFADGVNAFNKTMNLGNRLAQWFAAEFGSTQCSAITNCDFSSPSEVTKYVAGDWLAGCTGTTCRTIADRVAEKVQEMLANQQRGGPGVPAAL